ncbi:hypothetical protein GCM10010277_83200 [Streptomyces longisporoflavus]|nr:hypothetical protein [Streptomyces longisporoflavus]GGV71362.1 hypothetical protein GCM10010277_83200 [Streptomyces longisporoflavus]
MLSLPQAEPGLLAVRRMAAALTRRGASEAEQRVQLVTVAGADME